MKIVFRVDASMHVGSGHVIRCLTLANRLREQDAEILFVCRESKGHFVKLIERHGFSCRRLPVTSINSDRNEFPGQGSLYRANWQDDAEQTIQAIETFGSKIDWLVVDHYSLEKKWEDLVRKYVDRVLVIDDMANRKHECHMLLDQNLVANMSNRYNDMVPGNCSKLLGPEYALLHSDYAKYNKHSLARKDKVTRILIYFGGADNDNLTSRSLLAFLDLNKTEIEVDIVIASSCLHSDAIQEQIAGHENIYLHKELPTLVPLLAKADLSIGACGSTSWERICFGLPTLVVTLADNQIPVAKELNSRGLINWLGHHNKVSKAVISEALDKLIQQGLDQEFSSDCFGIVDGKGADRVSAAMTVSASTLIRVRHVREEDEQLLLEWKNDLATRRNAFLSEKVSASTHQTWLQKRLNNLELCYFYIIETMSGIPLGQVRFENQNEKCEVHYAVAPVYRGRGLGRCILSAAIEKLRSEKKSSVIVFGQTKEENYLSRKIFEALDFRIQKSVKDDIIVYQKEY